MPFEKHSERRKTSRFNPRQRTNVVPLKPPAPNRRLASVLRLASGGLILGSVGGLILLRYLPAEGSAVDSEAIVGLLAVTDTSQPTMEICGEETRYNCVVDGDTIWLRGEKIRVADIDTPEVGEPRCKAEYQLGMKATYRLQELLNEGPWSVKAIGDRDTDGYGRSLRVLIRDGHSIGDMLVAEGLARTWTGRREPWC